MTYEQIMSAFFNSVRQVRMFRHLGFASPVIAYSIQIFTNKGLVDVDDDGRRQNQCFGQTTDERTSNQK